MRERFLSDGARARCPRPDAGRDGALREPPRAEAGAARGRGRCRAGGASMTWARHGPALGRAVAEPALGRSGAGLSRASPARGHERLGGPGHRGAVPALRRALARRRRHWRARSACPASARAPRASRRAPGRRPSRSTATRRAAGCASRHRCRRRAARDALGLALLRALRTQSGLPLAAGRRRPRHAARDRRASAPTWSGAERRRDPGRRMPADRAVPPAQRGGERCSTRDCAAGRQRR